MSHGKLNMEPDIASEKRQLRKAILAARALIPVEVCNAHSAVITERLLQMPEYRQAETVLGYMNFGSEYASSLWVSEVLKEGKRLALPKVNRHTNRLDLYYVDDTENQLAVGLWGIREPVVERCLRLSSLSEVEFALLPGVAFDRHGARLGYGGGYYDKLLACLDEESGLAHRLTLVAAAYSAQLVEHIPQEATDRRLEWLVTENATLHCGASPGHSSKEQ